MAKGNDQIVKPEGPNPDIGKSVSKFKGFTPGKQAVEGPVADLGSTKKFKGIKPSQDNVPLAGPVDDVDGPPAGKTVHSPSY